MKGTDLNLAPKTELSEVRLSFRDLFSLTGLTLTLIFALWGFASSIEKSIVTIGVRVGFLEKRVDSLEAASSPERTAVYRRFMEQMRTVQPNPPE
jgi:hypothetical protein